MLFASAMCRFVGCGSEMRTLVDTIHAAPLKLSDCSLIFRVRITASKE
jgi:hypothetical protein